MIEDLVQQLIDRLDHQYLGKYRGYVHAVEDPEGRGRIRAIVPRLLGETTPTGWAEPASPYAGPDQGLFTVPDLGAGCWIEFEEGDLSKPIWSGCWWGAPTEAERNLPDSATRRATPETEAAAASGDRTPETPQHKPRKQPFESPEPKVRVFKSATGHHIVLDDRPESERIEIHDSKGNQLILTAGGLERILWNEKTDNRGNRRSGIKGHDELEVTGNRVEKFGSALTREVGGDAKFTYRGNFSESLGNGAYVRGFNHTGYYESFTGAHDEEIKGGESKTVAGAGNHTYSSGLGVSAAGPVAITSAEPFKVNAAKADLGLNAIAMHSGVGNVSINSLLGVMQLGGLSALSPMVLGDGLAIHHVMLSQAMKAINPPLLPFYGPLVDTWAAITPALDLSYFGYVKRMPVG